jgi:hypothetical protein
MKKTLLAILLVAAFFSSHAQGTEKQMQTSASASQVYLEAGGSGIIYTINFDKRFKKEENGWGFRIGLGGAAIDDDGYIAIPAQINYLYGNNGQYLELGAGASFFSTGDVGFSENTVLANAVIGFRKVPFGKKGFTWRVAFTPFIGAEGFYPWAGVSLGYRF